MSICRERGKYSSVFDLMGTVSRLRYKRNDDRQALLFKDGDKENYISVSSFGLDEVKRVLDRFFNEVEQIESPIGIALVTAR